MASYPSHPLKNHPFQYESSAGPIAVSQSLLEPIPLSPTEAAYSPSELPRGGAPNQPDSPFIDLCGPSAADLLSIPTATVATTTTNTSKTLILIDDDDEIVEEVILEDDEEDDGKPSPGLPTCVSNSHEQ